MCVVLPCQLYVCAVVQMCRMYRLSASKLVEEWIAFCCTKKLANSRVTMDKLDQLDREVI